MEVGNPLSFHPSIFGNESRARSAQTEEGYARNGEYQRQIFSYYYTMVVVSPPQDGLPL